MHVCYYLTSQQQENLALLSALRGKDLTSQELTNKDGGVRSVKNDSLSNLKKRNLRQLNPSNFNVPALDKQR